MILPRSAKRILKKMQWLREEAEIYSRIVGLRGNLLLAANLVCGHPKELRVTVDRIAHPVTLRLHTSDAKVCQEVLIDQHYDVPLAFLPATIVDVGANCGMTSVFYTNRYSTAKVWAIEPEPSNYAALVRNSEPYPNITPINAALWNTDGQVEVFCPFPKWQGWGKWGYVVRQGRGCRAFTLNSLMQELGIETIDILKIDVEGAELEIFSECNWMSKVRLLAIELHERERPGCSELVDRMAIHHRHRERRGYISFYQQA